MRLDSEFMRAHPPHERGADVPIHTLISAHDNIVSPPWSTVLGDGLGEDVLHPAALGHTGILSTLGAQWVGASPPSRRCCWTVRCQLQPEAMTSCYPTALDTGPFHGGSPCSEPHCRPPLDRLDLEVQDPKPQGVPHRVDEKGRCVGQRLPGDELAL